MVTKQYFLDASQCMIFSCIDETEESIPTFTLAFKYDSSVPKIDTFTSALGANDSTNDDETFPLSTYKKGRKLIKPRQQSFIGPS